MLKFATPELEKEVEDILTYFKDNSYEFENLFEEDNFISKPELYFDDDDDDFIIDENYEISMAPDFADEYTILTIRELIDLINEFKYARIIDNSKCLSNKRALIRVDTNNIDDYEIINSLFNISKSDGIFKIESSINNNNFSCCLINGVTLFNICVHFSGNYDEDYPSVMLNELFIEIIPQKEINLNDINKIYNAYIFELNATHGIKLYINPRPNFEIENFSDAEIVLNNEFKLRPLLFSKGIDELIKLFNEAETEYENYDYSIIQYVKIIEYVSQTVIRQDITKIAQIKLMNPKALRPDANYIKELETMFGELKQKYETDRSSIKQTIKSCCDIFEIIDVVPIYLDKIIKLKENSEKEKCDKENLIDNAYDLLAVAISDTRNYIAHAKANYTKKGKECPEEQKEQFVKMLKILSIQIIRWFSMTNEESRIVND